MVLNRRALVISMTHRGGKYNTDVKFATHYSDSAHIWEYVIRKSRSAPGENVAFVAAGRSIYNHIKTSGAVFIIR